MPESELINFESKLDLFVRAFQDLRHENNSLRNKLTQLTHENAALLDKKRKAITILRKIITQLKDDLLCHKK